MYLVELELEHYVIARPQDCFFPIFAALGIQIQSDEEAHHEEPRLPRQQHWRL
jgi:hypothetical protein